MSATKPRHPRPVRHAPWAILAAAVHAMGAGCAGRAVAYAAPAPPAAPIHAPAEEDAAPAPEIHDLTRDSVPVITPPARDAGTTTEGAPWLAGAMQALRAGLTEVADGQYSFAEDTASRDPRRVRLPPKFTRALMRMVDDHPRLERMPQLGLTVVEDPAHQTYRLRGFTLGFAGGIWLAYEMLDEREVLGTIQWRMRW